MADSQAARLLRLRKKLGISQRELAREFRVSSGAVALWERGTRPIPGPVLRLMTAFESHLWPHSDSPPDQSTIDKVSAQWSEEILLAIPQKKARERIAHLRPRLEELIRYYLCKRLPKDSIQLRAQLSIYRQIVQHIRDTRGLPLKLVQLACYLDPEMPAEMREFLRVTQDALSEMSPHIVSRVISEDFGRQPAQLFKKWDAKPIATASLGQVHRAQLKTGEWVAVKIQYPGIRKELEQAFCEPLIRDLLATLLWSGSSEILDEFRDSVLQECDYRKEAENQKTFKSFFEVEREIRIPGVIDCFCSDRVLTTEYVEGDSFDQFSLTASQSEKNHAAELLVRFQAHSFFQHGYIYADIHNGNLLFPPNQLAIVDFGRVIRYEDPARTYAGNLTKAILHDDIGAARSAVEGLGIVLDWNGFDFDEFWHLLREQHLHFAEDRSFKFTREYLSRKSRLSRSFSQKNRLSLRAPTFWNWFVVSTHDAIRADLDAEANWRAIMLESMASR